MQNKTEFIREIESVTLEVQQELSKRKEESKGYVTALQLQLEQALDELTELKDRVLNNKLPPKGKRAFAIAWHVVDSWSNDSVLGDKILVLERKYRDYPD